MVNLFGLIYGSGVFFLWLFRLLVVPLSLSARGLLMVSLNGLKERGDTPSLSANHCPCLVL